MSDEGIRLIVHLFPYEALFIAAMGFGLGFAAAKIGAIIGLLKK